MKIKPRGYAEVNHSSPLIWIEVRDNEYSETFYDPTYETLEEIASRYSLDEVKFAEVIQNLNRGTYGVVLIPEEFRRWTLEQSTVHLYYAYTLSTPVCEQPTKSEWIQFDHTAIGKLCEKCQDVAGKTIEKRVKTL